MARLRHRRREPPRGLPSVARRSLLVVADPGAAVELGGLHPAALEAVRRVGLEDQRASGHVTLEGPLRDLSLAVDEGGEGRGGGLHRRRASAPPRDRGAAAALALPTRERPA